MVGAEDDKAIVRRVIEEVVNGKNLAVADELFSDAYVLHPSLPGSASGPDRAKRMFASMHRAFPDLRGDIEFLVSEEDMVAARYSLSGTHEPTGKRATWPVAVFHRIEEGKIAEDWVLADTATMEAQLV